MGEGRLPGKVNALCRPGGNFSTQKPTRQSADYDPSYGCGNGLRRESPRARRDLPPGRNRFSQYRIKESVQYSILLLVRSHLGLFLRVGGKQSFHFAPAFFRQSAVDVSVQISF
jgi:hypothetical protein